MTTSEEHERLLSNLGRIQSETGELRRKLEELKTKLDSVKSFEERELFDQSLSQLARHITSLNSTILNDDNGVLDSWVLSPEILDPENLACTYSIFEHIYSESVNDFWRKDI